MRRSRSAETDNGRGPSAWVEGEFKACAQDSGQSRVFDLRRSTFDLDLGSWRLALKGTSWKAAVEGRRSNVEGRILPRSFKLHACSPPPSLLSVPAAMDPGGCRSRMIRSGSSRA